MIIQGTKVSFEEMQVDDKEGSFSCCELWWVWLCLASLAFFCFSVSLKETSPPSRYTQASSEQSNYSKCSYWIQKDMWIWYLQREWYFLGSCCFPFMFFFGNFWLPASLRFPAFLLHCLSASLLFCFFLFLCFYTVLLFPAYLLLCFSLFFIINKP